MTIASGTPPHLVLQQEAVKWAIDTLTAKRTHPLFLLYLHLRRQAVQTGQWTNFDFDLGGDIKAQLEMPGNTVVPGKKTKTLYRPLVDNKPKDRTRYWISDHLAGSYSPSSFRQAWLKTPDGRSYVLPKDHVAQAKRDFLKDGPVSALALGTYLFRNHGFVLDCDGHIQDVVAAFRSYFEFRPEHDSDFTLMFDTDVPSVSFDWFASPYALTVEDDTQGETDA